MRRLVVYSSLLIALLPGNIVASFAYIEGSLRDIDLSTTIKSGSIRKRLT